MRDLRYAFRMLLKNPGFTAVAALALALGIGANSALFTIINSVLLRPLPYPDSERLLLVKRRFVRGSSPSLSIPLIDYVRRNNRAFERIAAFDLLGAGYNLTGPEGEPERVRGVRVTAEFFRVIGAGPALGRGLLPEDDVPGAPRVVVITHGLWKRRFGADPGVVGRRLTLGAESYAVAGVMPAGFEFVPEADLWTPLQPVVKATDVGNYLLCLGRLKASVTREQAQADMERLAQRFRQDYPKHMGPSQSLLLTPLHEQIVGDMRPALLVLWGAVGCVLLIACANVANLLLARAATRHREIALRVALGARRRRLLRQLLTESTLLALVGGALGLLLGYWGLKALLAAAPARIPLIQVGMDARVCIFTLAVSLVTGVVFGMVPALQASRPDLAETLKEGSGRTTSGAGRRRLRSLLVAGEVAIALMLVVGAALLMETFVRLRSVQPGFDPHRVLTMQMSLTGPRFATTALVDDFFRRVLPRLEAVPGVEAAATVTNLPLELGPDLPFEIEGRSDNQNNPSVQWRSTTPHYFRAMKIPLKRGRYFTDGDTALSPAVIIINETFARRFWGNRDPVGERITLARAMGREFTDPPRQVVGVTGDVKELGLDQPPPLMAFVPCSQVPPALMALLNRLLPVAWVVRTAAEPTGLTAALQREILAVDRSQPVANVRTMEQVLNGSTARQNFSMLLLGLFAGLALLLATVGIYGVMSYSVSLRTHEIGVRMALGAGSRRVAALVLAEGMTLALAGVCVGLAASFGLTRLLAGLLFGVRPTDPATFAGVSILLLAVALAASYLPARRAMRVDPIIALRHE